MIRSFIKGAIKDAFGIPNSPAREINRDTPSEDRLACAECGSVEACWCVTIRGVKPYSGSSGVPPPREDSE
jgi:hypothetical protein